MSEDPILAALTRLDAGLLALQTGQRGLEAGLLAVRTDVMARLDRLQNTVEAMRDDITVNFAHATRVSQIANGTSAEVRSLAEEVVAMERQIRRLRSDVDELRNGA